MLCAKLTVAAATSSANAESSVFSVMFNLQFAFLENGPEAFWFGHVSLVPQSRPSQALQEARTIRRSREHGVGCHVVGREIGPKRKRVGKRLLGFVDAAK